MNINEYAFNVTHYLFYLHKNAMNDTPNGIHPANVIVKHYILRYDDLVKNTCIPRSMMIHLPNTM